MQQISIIIITYNRPDDLADLLQDILKLTHLHLLKEVIIINNCSHVSYKVVENIIDRKNHISFKYIEAKENLGVSRGRNFASSLASGDIFFYVDDDTNLKQIETLQNVLDAFTNSALGERKTGIASFKVLYSANGKVQENAFPHKNYNRYKEQHQFLTYYYAGCAHAISREAWLQAGEYPSNFFYGMEEYDLAFRVLNHDYSIIYKDSVVVHHKESPQGRTSSEEKIRMMWVNKTTVAYKYLPIQYFYSTALMWSMEYLKRTGFNFNGFIFGWQQVAKIPSKEKRQLIKTSTITYLKKVQARLWY